MLTDQEYYDMTALIKSEYGEYIRGKRVMDMPDRQIWAIYNSIKARKENKRYFGRKPNNKPLEYQMSIEDLKEASNV